MAPTSPSVVGCASGNGTGARKLAAVIVALSSSTGNTSCAARRTIGDRLAVHR